MSLKHIFMISIVCCFSSMHAGQQAPAAPAGIWAKGRAWLARTMTNAAAKGVVGTGLGYVWPKMRGASDARIRIPLEREACQGRFDVSLEDAFGYVYAVHQKLAESESQESKLKRGLREVCRGYGVDVMRKATIHLLSEQNMPRIPGPLIVRYFVAALGDSMLKTCLNDFFVQPCMDFGGRVRKFGFKYACGLSRSVSDILGEYPVRINRNGIL